MVKGMCASPRVLASAEVPHLLLFFWLFFAFEFCLGVRHHRKEEKNSRVKRRFLDSGEREREVRGAQRGRSAASELYSWHLLLKFCRSPQEVRSVEGVSSLFLRERERERERSTKHPGGIFKFFRDW